MLVALALLHLAIALFAMAALSLIGLSLVPRAHRPAHPAVRLLASVAIGMLACGWLGWVAGLAVGARVVPWLHVALFVIALRSAAAWSRSVRRGIRFGALFLGRHLLATALLGFTLLLLLPQLLIPIVDSDGLHYHLGFPKLYLLTNSLQYNRWDVASALPQLSEMLYLTLLRFADGESAKWLHAMTYVLALATLALVLHRSRPTRKAALLAPLLLAATPVVLAPAGAAFVDGFALFHLLVGALLLFSGQSLLLAGLVLAAAVATKITAAPAVAGLILYALVTRSADRRAFRTGALLIMPVVIAFAPFAIRNAWQTRDPIFPVGYALLHREPPGISRDRVDYAMRFHATLDSPLGIGWSPDPEKVQPDEVAGVHHLLGLLAALLALRDPRLRRWLAFVVPYLAVALVLRPPTRYLIPMFAGLSAIEAIVIVTWVRTRLLATGVALIVAAPALSATATLLFTNAAPFDYILGRVTKEQFLATRIPAYRAARLFGRLPPGGVLALDFPAVYYLDRPWLTEGVLNTPPLLDWLAAARTADDVVAEMRARDLRFLAVTPGYGGDTANALLPLGTTPHRRAILAGFRQHLRLVASIDGVGIYEVR